MLHQFESRPSIFDLSSFNRHVILRRCAFMIAGATVIVVTLSQVLTPEMQEILTIQKNRLRTPLSIEKSSPTTPKSVLCFLMISNSNLKLARAARDHWGQRLCDLFILFAGNETQIDGDDSDLTRLPLELPDASETLSHKAFHAYRYIHTHFPSYDWVVKADPDTYVIADNMVRLSSFTSFKINI
jgi:hypothetical protein